MAKVRSVVYIYNTQAEAANKAAELATDGFIVYVPSSNVGALKPLDGDTNEVVVYLNAVNAAFSAEGLTFNDEDDGKVVAIVAGVPETSFPQPIVSQRTKVYILKDRIRKDGLDLFDVETSGLEFDDYTVFVPSKKPANAAIQAGPPGPIVVTGETGALFFDSTDCRSADGQKGSVLVLPKKKDGSSYWVVTARKLLP